jgi:hypothetical protein
MITIIQDYIPKQSDNLIAAYFFKESKKLLIQPQCKLIESVYLVGIWKLKNKNI